MIGILGGTGPEGIGLAVRFALAGEVVSIGSRSSERASAAVVKVRRIVPGATLIGEDNATVATRSDPVIIALPIEAVEDTLTSIADRLDGKLVVSVVAALEWPGGRPRPVHLDEGSAAQRIEKLLPRARVTSGFHTLSAEKLADPANVLNEDCLVCGDDRDARRATIELAAKIVGVRPLSCGRLENSIFPELTVGLLATVNRIHKVHAGIRLVGIGDD